MLIRIVAVGTRMPAWVEDAVAGYAQQMPSELRVEWKAVKAEPRSATGGPASWMAREARRIREALPEGARTVVLDERGDDLVSAVFARRLARWREDGRPVALVIGGPDGIEPALAAAADERIRLSSMTLPHALVRVVLAEQLFRAWSILSGHPYHRE